MMDGLIGKQFGCQLSRLQNKRHSLFSYDAYEKLYICMYKSLCSGDIRSFFGTLFQNSKFILNKMGSK